MLARIVLVTGLVEVTSMPHELQAVEVGARTRIRHVSRWFCKRRTGGCGTESRYFGAEGITHHVFHRSNYFDLILGVCSRTCKKF